MILQIQRLRTISSHKKGQVKIYDNAADSFDNSTFGNVALLQHHILGFGHSELYL